ncbi:MAG: hypothetical protein WCD70_08135 [Alphaproteobacteria bacterium]
MTKSQKLLAAFIAATVFVTGNVYLDSHKDTFSKNPCADWKNTQASVVNFFNARDSAASKAIVAHKSEFNFSVQGKKYTGRVDYSHASFGAVVTFSRDCVIQKSKVFAPHFR